MKDDKCETRFFFIYQFYIIHLTTDKIVYQFLISLLKCNTDLACAAAYEKYRAREPRARRVSLPRAPRLFSSRPLYFSRASHAGKLTDLSLLASLD